MFTLYTGCVDTPYEPILSVRIDPVLMKRLDALVARTGVSRTEIVVRCLSVGLADEESFVRALENPLHGAIAQLAMHGSVLKVLFALTGGGEVDETQRKITRNIRKRRKGDRNLSSKVLKAAT